MAHLDEIIAVNDAARGKLPPPTGLSVDARRELCIITCVDPRLTRFFPTALGIERGDAVLIRVPGASLVTGHGDALRAAAAAVYINHAKEFLVLGHTDCGTTRIDPGAVTSEMRKRGVDPGSMAGGVRDFLGGVPDARTSVKATAAALRSAPFLPRDLLIHAAILDIETGALEVVERGEGYQPDAATGTHTSDGLGYRPGPSGALSESLHDGMQLLGSSGTALFDGSSSLASSSDPFASVNNLLPAGWSDAGNALSSGALGSPGIDISSIQAAPEMQLPQTLQASTPMVAPSNDMVSPMQAPRAAQATAPAAKKQQPRRAQATQPTPQRRAAPAPRPAQSSETDANVAKVRDFYRLEFSSDQRRLTARALAQAARDGKPSSELAKIVIKPILDLGQKRYRIIDEVIALKEQASRASPDDALVLLSQLFE